MKDLLVPIDFSPFSESAARSAVYLARELGATIHLLHVAHGPEDWNTMPVVAQQNYPELEGRIVEAEIKLDKFAASAVFKDCKTSTYVYTGAAHRQIADFAKAYKMDLIIMGAHGKGESQGQFIGSTAQRVMRTSLCPVLSVKKEFTPGDMKNIVFPCDLDEYTSKAIGELKKLAASFHATLNLLFVNTPEKFVDSEAVESKMSRIVEGQQEPRIYTHIYNAQNLEKGILNFTQAKKMDWIAMVTHNRKGKPDYQIGTTETVLFNTDVPVLSMIIQPN